MIANALRKAATLATACSLILAPVVAPAPAYAAVETQRFGYDRVDNSTVQIIGARAYTVGYSYDLNGEVTRIALPSGRFVTYLRAVDGQVNRVTSQPDAGQTGTNLVTDVRYRPFGEGLISLTHANGLLQTRSYDGDGRLTRIRVADGGDTPLDVGFTLDPDGRLAGVTDHAGGGRAATFGYTDDGRLASGAGPWGLQAFAYDGAGNRVQSTSVKDGATTVRFSVLPLNTNRLAELKDEVGAVKRTLAYRAGGSVSLDVGAGLATYEYLYNHAGRLVAAKQDGVLVGQYGYDWTGRRVTRETLGAGPTSRDYVYDLGGRLLAEYDGASGAVVREYAWLDDTPLAVFDRTANPAVPVTYHIHAGRLDEPLLMTDAAKAKVWDHYLEPYGAAGVFGVDAAALDLRLPGQSVQLETGALHQNWWRDYDPSTGRYMQADPLGLAAGQNLYAYVDADPLNAVDIEGLQLVRPAPRMTPRPGTRSSAMGSTAFTPIPPGTWQPAPGSPASRVQMAGPLNAPNASALLQAAQANAAQVCLGSNQPGAQFQRGGPGYYANRWIPGQPGRATEAQRREIDRIGRQDGCHGRGSTNPGANRFVPDHQPPSALGTPNRFYPHCLGCSRSQGGVVRQARRRSGG